MECVAWKDEIRTLWKRVGEASVSDKRRESTQGRRYRGRKGFCLGFTGEAGPGNAPVKKLLSDSRFTEAVIDFLRVTRVGDVKSGIL